MVYGIIKKIQKAITGFTLLKEKGCYVDGISPGKDFHGVIKIKNNSRLVLGNNIKFRGTLDIDKNSIVIIEDDCHLENINFHVNDNARVQLGKGTRLSAGPSGCLSIRVLSGELKLEGFNNIMADILVRFGGKLSIGKYTGIAYNSEIRCEDSIKIGDYGIFSYEVCIFDTDTHSTDAIKRRERIIAGYPIGAQEIQKPFTSPVSIGDDVWIGRGATVTKGAKIGNRCIIGIRTVVSSGDYDDDTTIVSNKPRIINKKND